MEQCVDLRVVECDRVLERRLCDHPGADQQCAVRDLGPGRRTNQSLVCVDLGERVVHYLGAGVGGQPCQRIPLRRARRERLGHSEWAVHERLGRGQKLELHTLSREIPKREGGLQPGDAGACDQHLQRLVVLLIDQGLVHAQGR